MGISNEEIRSLFLAAIMVTSVIAIGGIGFAGSAAAAPGDSGNDGITAGNITNITDPGESDLTTYQNITSFNESLQLNSSSENATINISSGGISEVDFDSVSNVSVRGNLTEQKVGLETVGVDTTNDVSADNITIDPAALNINVTNVTSVNITGLTVNGPVETGGYDIYQNGNSESTFGFSVVAADSVTTPSNQYATEDKFNITVDHSTVNSSVDNVSVAVYDPEDDNIEFRASTQGGAETGSLSAIYNGSDTNDGETKFETTGNNFANSFAGGNYSVSAFVQSAENPYDTTNVDEENYQVRTEDGNGDIEYFGIANLTIKNGDGSIISNGSAAVNVTGAIDGVGDDVVAELNSTLPGDDVEIVHNYTDADGYSGTNATFSAAKANEIAPGSGSGVQLKIDGTVEDVASYNVTNYSVEVNPDTAVSGEEKQISASVYKYDADGTQDLANDDADPDTLGYNISNTEETLRTDDTSTATFTRIVAFNVSKEPYTFAVNDTATPPANVGSKARGSADVDVGYQVDVTLEEDDGTEVQNPDLNQVLNARISVTDSDGNDAKANIQIRDNKTNTIESDDIDGTQIISSVDFNDSATWKVYDADSELNVSTIDVNQAEADLSFSAEGTNQQFSNETYTLELVDNNDNALTINKTGDEGNIDALGYVNVTGPFDNVTDDLNNDNVSKFANPTADGIPYLHVNITDTQDSVAVSTFNATPADDDVTAQLEVDENAEDGPFEGVEDPGIKTNATPDYTADAQTLTTEALGDLNVVPSPTSVSVNSPSDITVDVTGTDNLAPGDSDGTLANASVSITGPGIDVAIEEGDDAYDDPTKAYSFDKANVTPEQGENITVEVTAQTNASNIEDADTSETLTQTETITVDGDVYNNLTPTDLGLNAREDISVQITNKEGTVLNNRDYVNFTHSETSGFNVTDPNGDYQTGQTLSIQPAAGNVTLDGTEVETFTSINNGQYSIDGVKFDETGDVDFTVRNSGDLRVNKTAAIEVAGLDVYDIQTDVDPALAGSEEQHNITITEEGDRVTDSDLTDIVDNNNIDITQDGSDVPIVSGPTAVDLNDSIDNEDTIQVTINANNSATEPVNISVTTDGGDRSGEQSVEVVTPDVSTSLGEDALTLGLNNTDVEFTAEDPRTGDALAGGDVTLNATNTDFELAGANKDEIADDETATADLNENGSVTLAIGPNASEVDNGSAPISLDVSAAQNGTESFGDITVDVGNITFGDDSPPSQLDPNTDVTQLLDINDANGDGIDLARVRFSGTGLNTPDGQDNVNGLLDEGTQSFDLTTSSSGKIQVDLVDDIGEDDIEIVAANDDTGLNDGDRLNLAEINVLEESQLNLTADQTDIQQGDTVTFTLVREDFDQQTNGELTVYNADDEVVETGIEIDGTVERTFDTGGEFTVEAEKAPRPEVGTAFANDSVDVSVAEAVEPGAVQIDNVSLEPNEVDANTTNDHDLSFDALNVSADNSTDSFTVSIPDAATLDSANDLTVTTENVSAQNLNVDGNNITFDVNPDTEATDLDLSVEANVTVSVPNVSQETTADLTIDATDSDGTSDDASATLTITVQEAGEIPEDAVYEPGSTAAEFDDDDNGQISISELGAAGSAYANDELTISELGNVGAAYAASGN